MIKSFCELDYKDFSRLQALCEKAWVKEHLCIPDIWSFYGLTYGSMGLNCKPQADRGRGAIQKKSPLRHKHYASVIQPIRTLQGGVKTCQNTWVLWKPVIWLMGFYKNSLWNGIYVSCLKFKFPFVKTGLFNVACLVSSILHTLFEPGHGLRRLNRLLGQWESVRGKPGMTEHIHKHVWSEVSLAVTLSGPMVWFVPW